MISNLRRIVSAALIVVVLIIAQICSAQIAYYSAEGNANDTAGGHNGSMINGAGFAPGAFGQAFNLNGSNQYISVPDSSDWTFGSNNFTISIWANFDTLRQGALGTLPNVFVGHDQGGGTQNKWVFFHDGVTSPAFHVNGPGLTSTFIQANNSFVPAAGEWHHYSIKRSGSVFTFYVDGNFLGDKNTTVTIPNASGALTIGQAESLGFFDGRLDELRIDNRALDFEEIKLLAARRWNNALGGVFDDAANWAPTGVPTDFVPMLFDLNSAYTIQVQGERSGAFFVGNDDVTLDIGAGTTGYFANTSYRHTIGEFVGQSGRLTLASSSGPEHTAWLEGPGVGIGVAGHGELVLTDGVRCNILPSLSGFGAAVTIGQLTGSSGRLVVEDGAQVAMYSTDLGLAQQQAGSSGTLIVDGAGSSLFISQGYLRVGAQGTGAVRIDNGGRIASEGLDIYVGNISGPNAGHGDFVITGNGSFLDAVSSSVAVGANSSFSIEDGARATVKSLFTYVGGSDVFVRGTSSALEINQRISLSGGNFAISQSGAVSTELDVSINAGAAMLIRDAGSVLDVGSFGLFVGGPNSVSPGTGSNSLSILDGATVNVAGVTKVYDGHGTLTVNGGTLNTTSLDLTTTTMDFPAGVVSVTGGILKAGSLSLSGGSSVQQPTLNLDHQTGTISGALTVGNAHGGILNMMGGTLTSVTGILGAQSGATGFVELTGGAAMNFSGGLSVGGGPTASGGAGVMLVRDSAVNVGGTIKIWDTDGTILCLDGGTLTAAAIDTSGNTSRFRWENGTVNLTNGRVGSSGLGSSIVLDASRSLTVTGTLTIDAGSSLLITDHQTLNAGVIVNNGSIVWNSGTINLTNSNLAISASGPLGSLLTIDSDKTLGVSGTLSIANGAQLNLTGGRVNAGTLDTLGNPSRLNWVAGTLNLTNSGLTVGTTGPLGSNPSLTVGQTLILSGSTVVQGGSTLGLAGGMLKTTSLDIQSGGQFQWSGGSLELTSSGLNVQAGGTFGSGFSVSGSQRLVLSAANGSLAIGNTSGGVMSVASGGTVQAVGAISLGGNTGQSGTLTIEDVGSSLTGSSGMVVGNAGFGGVTIRNGASAQLSGNTELGKLTTGQGNIFVTGAGSTFSSSSVFIGGSATAAAGSGTFVVEQGARASGSFKLWGLGLLRVEDAILTGALDIRQGTFDFINGTVAVGSLQAANLTLAGGDSSDDPVLAVLSDGTGTVNNLTVGTNGRQATFEVLTGASVTTRAIVLGADPLSRGYLTVSGYYEEDFTNLATLNTGTNDLIAGQAGYGNVLQSLGVITTRNTFVGALVGGSGEVVIEGGLGGWTNTQSFYVGGTATASGGIGLLRVADEGALTIAGQLKVWNSNNPGGNPRGVVLDGGTITTGTLDTDLNPALLDWRAGVLNLTSAATLSIGATGPFGTNLDLNGARNLTVSGAVSVVAGSSLSVSGGFLRTRSIDIGGDPNRFSFTAGTLELTNSALQVGATGLLGSTPILDSTKTLRVSGATTVDAGAVLTLNGGSLRTASLALGGFPSRFAWSSGTLELTSSSLAVDATGLLGNSLSIGAGKNLNLSGANGAIRVGISTSAGSLTISNGGTLQNKFTSSIDGISATALVTGSGSSWTTTESAIQSIAINPSSQGSLTVQDKGSVNWSGDTLIASGAGSTGSLIVDDASFTTGGNLRMGNPGTATLTVRNGGQVTIAGALQVLNSASSVVLQGGTIRANSFAMNPGNFQWTSGTVDLTSSISVGPTGQLGPASTIDDTKKLKTLSTVNVQSGGMLTLNGGTIEAAELNLSGDLTRFAFSSGELILTTNSTFEVGAPMADGWTIAAGAHLRNDGLITVANTAAGNMNVAGGEVVSGSATFANSTTSSANVNIANSGEWDVLGSLIVGNAGDANLAISSGGRLSSTVASVAVSSDSQTTIDISGIGSRWTSGSILFGGVGAATMDITAGGEIVSGSAVLGQAGANVAEVTVAGASNSFRSKWSSNDLVVGGTGTADVAVSAGALVSTLSTTLGAENGASGSITVEGSANGIASNWGVDRQLVVGNRGGGTLSIEGDGQVAAESASIAQAAGSIGLATVSGQQSTWTITEQLVVGERGGSSLSPASLHIENGGRVSNAGAIIGSFSGSFGSAVVGGAGSTWATSATLSIGSGGSGTLAIADSGHVESANGIVGGRILVGCDLCTGNIYEKGTGSVTLDGFQSQWNIDNGLYIGGDETASGGVGNFSLTNQATVNVGTELHVWNGGTVSLGTGGRMVVGSSSMPFDGTLLVTSLGTVAGDGVILGDVLVDGGTVSPGSDFGTLNVVGDYEQRTGSNLDVDVTSPTEWDRLDVEGMVTLGGNLTVSLTDGFSPAAGQSFDILDAASISGAFSAVNLPSLATGLAWNLSQINTLGILSVGVSGDFDLDGDVDGRDFLIWQRGSSPNPLSPGDLAVWQANYSAGSPVTALQSVPEPAVLMMLLPAVMGLTVRRRGKSD